MTVLPLGLMVTRTSVVGECVVSSKVVRVKRY